jgi:hypothetical protein
VHKTGKSTNRTMAFRKDGNEKYKLHAHVMAANLVLNLRRFPGLTLSDTIRRLDCSRGPQRLFRRSMSVMTIYRQ